MNEWNRVELVRRIKGIGYDRGVVFPIRHVDLSVIGYLRAVDRSILDDWDLIRTMAESRTRNRRYFLTQFDASPENKRAWLENGVLKNDDKVLFLVEAHDHTVVGQDGFTLMENGVFSLDGTMRWLKYGHKDLYVRSGVERAAICFFLLSGVLSTTEVFSDNIANMTNSARMGHEAMTEHELFLSERDFVFRYEKIEGGSAANTDRKLTCFEMTQTSFIDQHRSIFEHPSWVNIDRLRESPAC